MLKGELIINPDLYNLNKKGDMDIPLSFRRNSEEDNFFKELDVINSNEFKEFHTIFTTKPNNNIQIQVPETFDHFPLEKEKKRPKSVGSSNKIINFLDKQNLFSKKKNEKQEKVYN